MCEKKWGLFSSQVEIRCYRGHWLSRAEAAKKAEDEFWCNSFGIVKTGLTRDQAVSALAERRCECLDAKFFAGSGYNTYMYAICAYDEDEDGEIDPDFGIGYELATWENVEGEEGE